MATTGKIEFPPIENGLDYLKSTVEHLRDEPTPRDLKYAVLHLQAAVEVLLKVRLIREHWSLVFTKENQASRVAYDAGDFISVNLDDTMIRLRGIAGVELGKATVEPFKRLSQIRNKLQHFGLVDHALAIESLAGQVLDSLMVFIREHLVPGSTTEELEALRQAQELIGEEIPRLKALEQARMTRISGELTEKANHVVACPGCTRLTLDLRDVEELSVCLFCDKIWDDPESLAQQYALAILFRSWHDPTEGGEEPVRTCPECGSEALVDHVEVLSDRDSPAWVCFNCRSIWTPGEIQTCAICSGLMVWREGYGIVCDDCFEAAVHKE